MKSQLYFIVLLVLILSNGTANAQYVKLDNKQIIHLIKVDSLNNRIYKILSPKNQVLSKGQLSEYPMSSFYVDRYLDKSNDSIVIKFRKLKKSDNVLKKDISFYLTYGVYADSITSKINIDCNNIDALLKETYQLDKKNRTDGNNDQKIDALNQRLLFNIFDTCDFLYTIKNKKESSHYALIILLHSNTRFQKKYLHLIEKAVKKGYLTNKEVVYLYDKILVDDKKLQKYGTQSYYNEQGNLELLPYDNIYKVNKRRVKVGLTSITLSN
ncbi:hypothetical protein LNQ81_11620 [Myroides sp. M-43]|uniref:hypothetical protein n=1 Tax=Myroides oncorhynchi TaxID=2893756 RepID=UPI001E2BA511|nr:hypothetical protein [Myroides oncorhynchi]MCC9043319.1 hypothetical protein [Myroides oncorhynchi]